MREYPLMAMARRVSARLSNGRNEVALPDTETDNRSRLGPNLPSGDGVCLELSMAGSFGQNVE